MERELRERIAEALRTPEDPERLEELGIRLHRLGARAAAEGLAARWARLGPGRDPRAYHRRLQRAHWRLGLGLGTPLPPTYDDLLVWAPATGRAYAWVLSASRGLFQVSAEEAFRPPAPDASAEPARPALALAGDLDPASAFVIPSRYRSALGGWGEAGGGAARLRLFMRDEGGGSQARTCVVPVAGERAPRLVWSALERGLVLFRTGAGLAMVQLAWYQDPPVGRVLELADEPGRVDRPGSVLACDPDGFRLVLLRGRPDHAPPELELADLAAGRRVRLLPAGPGTPGPAPACPLRPEEEAPRLRVAFAPGGASVALEVPASRYQRAPSTVLVFDAATGRLVLRVQLRTGTDGPVPPWSAFPPWLLAGLPAAPAAFEQEVDAPVAHRTAPPPDLGGVVVAPSHPFEAGDEEPFGFVAAGRLRVRDQGYSVPDGRPTGWDLAPLAASPAWTDLPATPDPGRPEGDDSIAVPRAGPDPAGRTSLRLGLASETPWAVEELDGIEVLDRGRLLATRSAAGGILRIFDGRAGDKLEDLRGTGRWIASGDGSTLVDVAGLEGSSTQARRPVRVAKGRGHARERWLALPVPPARYLRPACCLSRDGYLLAVAVPEMVLVFDLTPGRSDCMPVRVHDLRPGLAALGPAGTWKILDLGLPGPDGTVHLLAGDRAGTALVLAGPGPDELQVHLHRAGAGRDAPGGSDDRAGHPEGVLVPGLPGPACLRPHALLHLPDGGAALEPLLPRPGPWDAAAADPAGRLVAVADPSGPIEIWALPTPGGAGPGLVESFDPGVRVRALAFSAGAARLLYATRGEILVHPVAGGERPGA